VSVTDRFGPAPAPRLRVAMPVWRLCICNGSRRRVHVRARARPQCLYRGFVSVTSEKAWRPCRRLRSRNACVEALYLQRRWAAGRRATPPIFRMIRKFLEEKPIMAKHVQYNLRRKLSLPHISIWAVHKEHVKRSVVPRVRGMVWRRIMLRVDMVPRSHVFSTIFNNVFWEIDNGTGGSMFRV